MFKPTFGVQCCRTAPYMLTRGINIHMARREVEYEPGFVFANAQRLRRFDWVARHDEFRRMMRCSKWLPIAIADVMTPDELLYSSYIKPSPQPVIAVRPENDLGIDPMGIRRQTSLLDYGFKVAKRRKTLFDYGFRAVRLY